MQLTLLACVLSAAATAAMPSYIAVPADQIAFVDLSEMRVRRVPRQTLAPPPLPNLYGQQYQPLLQYQDHEEPLQLYQEERDQPLQQYQQEREQPLPLYQQDPSGLLPPAPEPPARLLHLQRPKEPAPQATLGSSAQLAERPPDFGEFVDFGAHTGDNGAFGWYADYPINNHHEDHHSGFRK